MNTILIVMVSVLVTASCVALALVWRLLRLCKNDEAVNALLNTDKNNWKVEITVKKPLVERERWVKIPRVEAKR